MFKSYENNMVGVFMQWMTDDEYSNLTGLEISAIEDLIERGKLTVKVEDGVRYIDPSKGSGEVVPAQLRPRQNKK